METKPEPKPKVTIAVPIWKEPISPTWLVHYQNLERPKVCEYLFRRNLAIHRGRRDIVKESSGEYIFFLDSDILAPKNAIVKLLEHNVDIVSGLYFGRSYPYNPIIYKKIDNEPSYVPVLDYKDGLVEVDGVGLGCCLIKRKVFESISEPWFDLPALTEVTEDFYFCNKAKEAGFRIYVDTTIKCGHIGESTIDEKYFLAIKSLMKTSKSKMI